VATGVGRIFTRGKVAWEEKRAQYHHSIFILGKGCRWMSWLIEKLLGLACNWEHLNGVLYQHQHSYSQHGMLTLKDL
jgi:hypothetical protein